jgi:uncharacterized protein YbaP (TraB family)
MKNIIITIILLVAAQVSFGQNTILWKVTDTINNKTSFIVGTFHQFGNSFVDSIPQIKESLLNSDFAVFESIDKIENTRKMIDKREASLEIEKRLKKKDLIKLRKIAKEWKVDLYKLKPLEIRWKLQQEFQKTKCKTTKPTDKFDHFDKYLQHLAEENQVELLGFETDSLQLNLIETEFKNSNWKKERKKISAWIKQMTTDNPNMNNCGLAIKYRKFDLNYDFENECESNILILQRNNDWMKTIPNLLRTKNTFIAVGYIHLRKKCGILQQLKSKGFKIEPIEIKSVANN